MLPADKMMTEIASHKATGPNARHRATRVSSPRYVHCTVWPCAGFPTLRSVFK